MKKKELYFKYIYIIFGIMLLIISIYFPLITKNSWFNIIYRIKEAVTLGDSGHLILASAVMSFLYALQNSIMFLGIIFIMHYIKIRKSYEGIKLLCISIFIASVFYFFSFILNFQQELITTALSFIICLLIYEKLFQETNSFFIVFIMSFQVFFAFQWINIMPLFSPYHIGQTDIPYSIKIAALYLNSAAVLNFTGWAFFLPLIFLAFTTSTLFVSYSKNMRIIKDNYEKQKEIQNMKAKIMQSRINNEMKTLVHDLKTPLVTIRGLSSLLSISKDYDKIQEYCQRIEGSVDKMNEMISCFLYESSKQKIKTEELINYVRAQLPLEDNSIKIDIKIYEGVPDLYVNKIRMARAIMNILENAIIVPCIKPFKHIVFEAKPLNEGVKIIVKDNGIGIDEGEIIKIFEMGYSTNNTSGLGLWFAKKVVEENEGKIEILSTKEEGTTVLIYLPSA